MSISLKIAVVLIILAAAVNIFLFFNDDIKRSDLILPQDAKTSSSQVPGDE